MWAFLLFTENLSVYLQNNIQLILPLPQNLLKLVLNELKKLMSIVSVRMLFDVWILVSISLRLTITEFVENFEIHTKNVGSKIFLQKICQWRWVSKSWMPQFKHQTTFLNWPYLWWTQWWARNSGCMEDYGTIHTFEASGKMIAMVYLLPRYDDI